MSALQFGEALHNRRHAIKMTQRDLAEQAGVSEDYISLIERNLRQPSAELLERLAMVLRVPAAYLMWEAEPVNPDLSPETRAVVEELRKTMAVLLLRIDELQRKREEVAE